MKPEMFNNACLVPLTKCRLKLLISSLKLSSATVDDENMLLQELIDLLSCALKCFDYVE